MKGTTLAIAIIGLFMTGFILYLTVWAANVFLLLFLLPQYGTLACIWLGIFAVKR